MSTTSGDGNEGPARWSVRLFGGFELNTLPEAERVNLASKRDRVLLAYLLLSPNHRQPRRKLTTLLWGEASDETSLDNLRVCVWSLRKALGDTKHRIIASEGDEVVLNGAAFDADVLKFIRLADQADERMLEAAANLYVGELLEGLSIESEPFESWRRSEALRLRTEQIGVLVRLMTQLADAGQFDRAVEIGGRVLTLDPLHEPTIRRLMRVHAGNGRRGVALQLYRTLTDALHAQLGAQPEAETRVLFAEIARGPDLVTGLERKNVSIGRQSFLRRPNIAWSGAGALAAALAIVLLLQQTALAPVPSDGVDAAKSAAASPASAVSIAVLPFLNLSGDASQDVFSDGITEEISATLARVPDLRVVARTSAFQFRGQNQDVQSIGRQLHATHIMEGSVRRENDRVRITAHLIDAASGVRVSSETYDRQLSDIFSTQEDIARNVVGALMAPLGLAPGERLVTSRGIDPESYQQFLGAKWLVPRSAIKELNEAIELLEPIVARYPDFAPAWGQLALAYQRIPFFSPNFEYWTVEEKRSAGAEWLSKSEAASKRAIELDPNLPDGYSSLALTMTARGELVEADRLFTKALALDPLYPEALHSYANLLGAVGHTREALAMRGHLMGLEPLVLLYTTTIPDLLWINGDVSTAIANMMVTRSPIDLSYLAKIYAGQGRRADAVNALKEIPPRTYPEGMIETAARLMEASPADASSVHWVQLARRLNFIYITAGALEKALERFEVDAMAKYSAPNLMVDLWTPIYAPVRKTERFKAFARNAGLVDYWRQKGWPVFCNPTAGDDFACH